MSTTILLVRHGETDWNREKIFRGVYDVPLNDNGRLQAQLAAKALRLDKIDAGYTSPLSRAVETATIVLGPHGIHAKPHQGLLDINYGDWTGKSESEVVRNWPEEHAIWSGRPHQVRIPGGDTLEDVFDRAFGAMEEIAERHDGQTVALFAHRVVNKLLVLGALGLTLDRFPFILQGNCCIDKFTRVEGGYLIEYLNDTSHIRYAGADVLEEDF
jgi:broad specificity phosphatase PhoE